MKLIGKQGATLIGGREHRPDQPLPDRLGKAASPVGTGSLSGALTARLTTVGLTGRGITPGAWGPSLERGPRWRPVRPGIRPRKSQLKSHGYKLKRTFHRSQKSRQQYSHSTCLSHYPCSQVQIQTVEYQLTHALPL